ncbi:MAG: hypothetical protein U9R08_05490 [Nanoarchaeota archaeon]|nr:hypothetical protein [Nanoarchaeota archaeon]
MKKGFLTGETLVGLIMIAIIAVILIAFVKQWASGLDENASFMACKNSNSFRVSNMLSIGPDRVNWKEPLGPLACNTWSKTLKGSKTEVEKEFGQLIGRCWDQFLQGKYSPMFGDYENWRDKCFICYTVNIDKIEGDEVIYPYIYKSKLKDIDYKVQGQVNSVSVLDHVQKNGYVLFGKDLEIKQKKRTYAIAFASEGWYSAKGTGILSYITNYLGNFLGFIPERPRNSIIVDGLGNLTEHCAIEASG